MFGQGSWLIQRFPDAALTGKMVTVSVLMHDGTLLSGSAIYNMVEDQNVTVFYFNAPGVMNAYAQNDETEGMWRIVLVNDSAVPLKPVAAKFELGPVQTLAHKDADGSWVLNDPPPDKALELLKCQRYFVRVYYDQYDTIGISSSNSEWIGLIMPLPTNMRLKQPSVSVTCHPKRISDNLELPAPSGCTVSGAVATVQFYHSGSTIAAYVFAAQQGYIEFDANL